MNLWSLIPLLSCVAYAALLVLALQQFRKPVNRVFALFLFASFAWAFFAFMLSYNSSASSDALIFWNNLVIVSVIWSVVSYYHFVRIYTNRPSGVITYCLYAGVVVVLGLSFFGFVTKDASFINGRFHHDIGPWVFILIGILMPIIAVTMVMLVKKYRALKDPMERNKIAYLIVGISIVAFYGPLSSNIPALAVLPTDHLGTLANALIIGYVIRKYKLLDIGFLARRALAYTMLTILVLSVYAGGLYFEIKSAPFIPSYITLITISVLSVLLYTIIRPMRYIAEEKVDRIFHRHSYAHRQALLEFSSKITNTIELDEVANEMLSTLGRALRLTHTELLFRNEGDFITQFTYPQSKVEANDVLRLNRDSAIALWLAKEDKPLNIADMSGISGLQQILSEEGSELSDPRLALLLPITSQERMVGILALGNRQSGDIFHPEDIELAAAIAKQASIVIENAQLYAQAKQRANIDELTGLFNHRHFHQRLDEEIARSSRFGDVFSVFIIDLDFFKSYNDIHGHLYGDNILRRVGEVIKNNLRAIDVAARYGGDEFSVILPQTSLDSAMKVADRLRNAMESEVNNKGMTVTCSIGVASWPTDGVMKENLLGAADAALYHAKKSGRNRACMASKLAALNEPGKSSIQDNNSMILNTIYALAATVDAKDHYTYGHSKKVSKYACDIATVLGYSEEKIAVIRTAGLLHDIGKIGVSDEILCKNTALNDDEWEPIHAHPSMGVSILKHVDSIKECLPGVQYHHERYDGKGYPQGLKGENIPLDARILAVADTFDAMTSSRPYRNNPLTHQQAIEELIRCSGAQFDSKIVEVFIQTLTKTTRNKAETSPTQAR